MESTSQKGPTSVPFTGSALAVPEAEPSAADIDGAYYDFADYVTKPRMMTFFHQISEVLELRPKTVLEVGIGPRVVSGSLKEIGVDLESIDVNISLEPDHLGSVLELDQVVGQQSYDVVLCARVLHHLSFAEFEPALAQLAGVARRAVVLTLPRDELRMYFGFRRTAGEFRYATVPLPRSIKSALLRRTGLSDGRYRQLWKVDSHPETTQRNVNYLIERHFVIKRRYAVPEDQSHLFYVLEPLHRGQS